MIAAKVLIHPLLSDKSVSHRIMAPENQCSPINAKPMIKTFVNDSGEEISSGDIKDQMITHRGSIAP
jgi:hypothetical protein